MLLNRNEIESLNLLTNVNVNNFCAHSYDLSAQEIITFDNKVVTQFEIPPQSMAIVVSKEQFDLSEKNIVGFTTVKNTLSRKGIMAVNIGLVDPGYIGPISSILLNFGKKSIEIKQDDKFLRITFQKFNPLDESLTPNCIQTYKQEHNNYVEQRKNEAHNYLDSSFLYINEIKKDLLDQAKRIAKKSSNVEVNRFKSMVANYVTNTSLVIGALGLVFTAIFGYLSYQQGRENVKNDTVINKLDSLQTIIRNLELSKKGVDKSEK